MSTAVRIFVSTFCELLSMLMLAPLLTLRLAQRGEDSVIIGWLSSSLFAAIIVATPLVPFLVKRFGVSASYRWSGAVPLCALALIFSSEKLILWFVAVWILGLAGGVRWVVGESFVAQSTPPAQRGALLGAYETMVGAIFVLAPLILYVTGIEGRLPLFVALVLVIAGVAVLWRLQEPVMTTTEGQVLRRIMREHPMLLMAALLGGLFESGPGTFLPLQAFDAGWSAADAALVVSALGLGGVIAPWPLGILADRRPLYHLLSGCTALMLLAALALFLLHDDIKIIWWIALAWGAAGGGIFTLAAISASRHYAGEDLVGATAAVVFAYSVGAALGPALLGHAIAAAPRYGFPLVMSALGLAGVLGFEFHARSESAFGVKQ